MISNLGKLQIVRFYVCGDGDDIYDPDFPRDINSAHELLNKLRETNPESSYTLIAEIYA